MNQPAPVAAPAPHPVQTAPVAAPAPERAERTTPEQRASALKEKLDSSSESAVEDSATAAPSASSAADSGDAEAKPEGEDAERQRRADRLQKLAQVRAKEDAARQQREQRPRAKQVDSGEMEKLRKRVAELEPNEKIFASEEALLAAAEAKGMSAEKLVQWMRTRLTDPNAVAQKHVQSEAEKLRAEIKALQERIDKSDSDRVEERKQSAQDREQHAKTSTFLEAVVEKQLTHPRVARCRHKHGDQGLVLYANHCVANLLPEGYGVEELHDHLEQFFEETEAFGGGAQAPATASKATPPKNLGADQPAITLDNRTTAGRETVVEAKPLHQLSKAERIARARAKYERE